MFYHDRILHFTKCFIFICQDDHTSLDLIWYDMIWYVIQLESPRLQYFCLSLLWLEGNQNSLCCCDNYIFPHGLLILPLTLLLQAVIKNCRVSQAVHLNNNLLLLPLQRDSGDIVCGYKTRWPTQDCRGSWKWSSSFV